jgi:hypothetical protein
LGAAPLDLDSLAGALTRIVGELAGTEDLDAVALTGEVRTARYEGLLAAAEDTLRVGTPAVLIAPFSTERADPGAWTRVRDRLASAGGRPRLVWLRVDPDELVRRLRRRGAERDVAKLADPAGFLARHPRRPPAVEHIAVDAAAPLGRQVAAVLDEVLGPPPGATLG